MTANNKIFPSVQQEKFFFIFKYQTVVSSRFDIWEDLIFSE